MQLEELELRIKQAADARYGEFLAAFLRHVERMQSPLATLEAQQKFMAFWRRTRYSGLPRLEKRARASRSAEFQKTVERYCAWLQTVGFYSDGSGGPRHLKQMSEARLEELKYGLVQIVGELRAQDRQYQQTLYWQRGWRNADREFFDQVYSRWASA